MAKKGKKTNNITYGIVGLGRFGLALAKELAQADADLIVIDRDEDKVRELRQYTDSAFIVKGSLDKKTLMETGIQNADIAVVCIAEHMDTSILTTLNLVNLGVPSVVAKASSIEHGEILEKLGAEVVYPERDMAIRLAHRLEASRMLDYIQLSEQLNISKLIVPDKISGRTVLEENLRARFGVNIIAIESKGKLIQNIGPGYKFSKGDIMFVAGSKEDLARLSEWAVS